VVVIYLVHLVGNRIVQFGLIGGAYDQRHSGYERNCK
jgi:hypothetical protein